MRALAFILSFVILGLSCLPCTDGKDAVLKDGNSAVVVSAQINGNESHSDFCNPFCSCSCCGIQLSHAKAVSLTPELPGYNIKHSDSYISSIITPLPAIIWQPPQLVSWYFFHLFRAVFLPQSFIQIIDMARSRLRSNRKRYSKKIQEPKWSKHKKVSMAVVGIILSFLMILAIIGALIKYYRLVTK